MRDAAVMRTGAGMMLDQALKLLCVERKLLHAQVDIWKLCP
jgi:hypothetical protein